MSSEDARFEALLHTGQQIAPPRERVAESLAPDHQAFYTEAMADLDAFWRRAASEVEWFRPYDRLKQIDYPNAKWFLGGECNITHNCLDRHLTGARKNKAALIWLSEEGEERIFTYAMLHRAVAKLASSLKDVGVKKGDRVCIYMPLTPEGIITMLACARIGAVHSVVYAGLGSGALRSRIEDAAAKVVICADVGYRRGKTVALKPIVDEALAGVSFVERVIVHRRQSDAADLAAHELDFDELLAGGSPDCPAEVMQAEDPLFILYTSGSTGKPKGTAYVHGGYMVGVPYIWKLACDIMEDDIYWCTSDIGWIVGHSIMVYGPFICGTTVVVREGAPDYPNPGICWEIVEKYGVTKMYTAPTALRMFMKFGPEWPQKHDLSSLKLLNCAGEPLNPEAWLWTYRHIMQERGIVADNWWQTELPAPVLGTWPSMAAKPGKVGKPFPGIDAAVVDRAGNPVAPGQGGLLVIKTFFPHMMRTIWGDPARYEEYFTQLPDAYVAGDVATVDADGYYTVLGRSDDVLNVAGHRIGTADVESALVAHPSVAEAAVIGKPDPIKGEAIKAFVTVRAGHEPTDALRAELVEHVRKVLGPIASPSELEFVTGLPKTRSGKIMRRVLKARELGQDPGDLTTIEQ